MSEQLYYVTLPYATYGVVTDGAGRIIVAPPIVSWALGKPIATLITWVSRKGGLVLPCP